MNAFTRILICITVFLVISDLCQASTQDKLKSALETYEDFLFQLILSGSSSEKASAVRGFAELGSPRYENARDTLISEKDAMVKKALLESISLMTDTSEQAKVFVTKCLTSDSVELILPACTALSPKPDVTFDFKNLWKKSSLLRLWKEYGFYNNCGSLIPQLKGIGEARPWTDPAWDETSRELQKVLLERAATREAIEVLRQIGLPEELHYTIGEPVDPVFLNELVVGSDSSLKSYAARSLITAKNATYIERVRSIVHQSLQDGRDKDEAKIDGLDIYWALPFLDDIDIRRLALKQLSFPDGDQWQRFSTLNRELNRRGKPFFYHELSATNFPHIPETHLRFFRFNPLRQRIYHELPSMLKELLLKKSELQAHSFLDFRFLSDLPEPIAHECFTLLQSQLPEKLEYSNRNESETILRLMGLFARGKDQEMLWKRFRLQSNPRMDEKIYIPVLWGFNQRSAQLRKILQPPDSKWLPSPNEEYHFGLPNDADCAEPLYLLSTLPFKLPISPDRVWNEGLDLTVKLHEIYGNDGWQSLINDFLNLRGVQISNRDLPSALLHLKDHRFVVRRLVVSSLKDRFPSLREVTYPFHFMTIDDFLDSHTIQIESHRGFIPSLPGPRLSSADERWFQKLLQKAKEIVFQRRINEFYNPSPPVITSSVGPSETKIYPAQPSEHFLQDGSHYLGQLNRLKISTDDNLRYAVLWALWHLNRDPEILQVWMKDANTTDVSATGLFLKARALFVLQKIRYKPSANLFLPLLHHSKPLLRQTALFGVQTFKMNEAFDDVKQLLNDPDEAVSETAIATLGWLRSEESQAILIDYLNGTYRQSFVANAALKRYRRHDDIDEMAEYLQRPNLTGQQRIMLFDVVSELTYRAEPNWKYQDTKFEKVPDESIDKWLRWWKENKNKPRITWYETAVGEMKLHEHPLPYRYLLDFDPEIALRLIFARFVEGARQGKWEADFHELLVNHTGEDFGNPGLAFCSAKDQILEDWIRWGKKQGLYSN